MMLSSKCYRSHWNVKIVFLNSQNVRTDNFGLVKSCRNICKWVYFLAENECYGSFFFKYCPLYFKDIPFF